MISKITLLKPQNNAIAGFDTLPSNDWKNIVLSNCLLFLHINFILLVKVYD